ncbi:uncharacterized protein LOC131002759 [Salvia miltiorrhiza]|uniref:uncharacterized protein LOC131002759 n=1 Tax=Salvia miltiorrhiza TaxID=226208 RepID=UPI0025ABB6BE|nr:uncharacterized protein LOC131002759 [Salvia miltiorrhiza]
MATEKWPPPSSSLNQSVKQLSTIPLPPGDEVAPKLVRLLYFVGAGIVCTVAINKWKEYEKKSMIQKEQ